MPPTKFKPSTGHVASTVFVTDVILHVPTFGRVCARLVQHDTERPTRGNMDTLSQTSQACAPRPNRNGHGGHGASFSGPCPGNLTLTSTPPSFISKSLMRRSHSRSRSHKPERIQIRNAAGINQKESTYLISIQTVVVKCQNVLPSPTRHALPP